PLGWNGSDPQRRRRARSVGLGVRSLPCSRPMGVCFALCNRYDLSLDGTNVVFRSQQDLQPSHPSTYRDYIADFRKLVDINGIIFLAGQSSNSAANVTGRGLHFLQRNHVDLPIPCLMRERLEVQLFGRGFSRTAAELATVPHSASPSLCPASSRPAQHTDPRSWHGPRLSSNNSFCKANARLKTKRHEPAKRRI